MLQAFSFEKTEPKLKLSSLKTRSQQDEQKGLQYLAAGGIAAFRNVASHEDEWRWDRDEVRTLECLALASLLSFLVDDCEAHSWSRQIRITIN